MIQTDDLRVQKLRTHAVRDVYRKYLRNDFPRDERRPLRHMMRMRRGGRYECYGVFCKSRLVCYAFFILAAGEQGRRCMLDYFAVLPEMRGSGIGAWFLSQMERLLPQTDLILAEVEDPDREADPDKKAVQERRLKFYMQNGMVDTGIRAETFGVPYRILRAPLPQKKPEAAREEICRTYEGFYRLPLKKGMFETCIRFTEL